MYVFICGRSRDNFQPCNHRIHKTKIYNIQRKNLGRSPTADELPRDLALETLPVAATHPTSTNPPAMDLS